MTLGNAPYKILFQAKDPSFRIDQLGYYDLYIELAPTFIKIGVMNIKSNKWIAIEEYEIVSVLLDEFIENHSLLKHKEWKSIHLVYTTEIYTLIPAVLFDKNNLKSYLSHASSSISSEDRIMYYEQKNKLTTVFSVPQDIYSQLKKTYPKNSISWIPHISSTIEYVFSINKEYERKTVFLFVEKNFFSVVIAQGEKILFTNVFSYSSSNDAVFYIMFACSELKVNSQADVIYLFGNFSSDLFSKLKTYFQEVHIGNLSPLLNLSSPLQSMKNGYKYATLLGSYFCK